jgi:hypothetical protein
MNTGTKSSPIPTRFSEAEIFFLDGLAERTGLSKAELIRRSVHALREMIKTSNDAVILTLAV